MPNQPQIELGIVLYPGAQMATVFGLTDLFGIAGRLAGRAAGADRAPLRISHWQLDEAGQAATRVEDSHPDACCEPSVLILPPSLEEPISAEAARPYRNWLCSQHQAGARLASICADAFLLAETGLLAARPATTHWSYVERFTDRFPDVLLDADQLIIDAGDLITAGGLMAWTDLGLRLVDRYLGAKAMIDTAQMLVIDPPGRQQSYYSAFSPRLNHGDSAILAVQQWLQETAAEEVALAELASRAGLEPRTFLRRFRKATGMTSTDYWQRLRVARASELLQAGRLSIERVAWEVGYADPGAFRKVFTRVVGLTPGAYRRRFGMQADAVT